MAKGITLEVEGLQNLIKKFGALPALLSQEIDGEMEAASMDFVDRAVSDAPKDVGLLAQEISYVKHAVMNYEWVSAAEYSAWVEFGTKSRVQVPPDLMSYAAQFKGKSSGKNVKQKIFEWCKRVGIEQDLWYPIFISIMTKGIKAHPFFFKQREPVLKQFRDSIKPTIRKALDK